MRAQKNFKCYNTFLGVTTGIPAEILVTSHIDLQLYVVPFE